MWRLQFYFCIIFSSKNLSVVTKKMDIPATALITVYINVEFIVHNNSYHSSLQATFLP